MSASTPRSSGLGRGLASLIPARTAALAAPTEIPLGRIRVNPYQPRQPIEDGTLQTLAASIAEHGVLQPILVTETLDGYQLIAGERRLRAAQLAGLERIPAVVRQLADHEQLELALVENIQRADLNALEEAAAYRQLVDEFGLSQEDVARRVGRARSSVANTLRLLDLSPAVQQAIRAASITEGHGRAIAALESPPEQEALLATVIARGLSVRQTEELARRLKSRPPTALSDATDDSVAPTLPAAPATPPGDSDLERAEFERMEADLRAALGTKVSLTRSRNGGRILIEFYDNADLERLYERLMGGAE